MDNQRNLLLAVVLCGLLLVGWDFAMRWVYPEPAEVASSQTAPPTAEPAEQAARTREGGLTDPADVALEKRDLDTELKAAARIAIDAERIGGSINPVGARIDDIVLKDHRQTVDEGSGPVRMFSPAGTPAQHFAQFGFLRDGQLVTGPSDVWQTSGGPLGPESPVILTRTEGNLRYTIELTVDDNFMLTAEQTVANLGTGSAVVQPFALLNRTDKTASESTWILHSGPIGAFGDGVDFGLDYGDLAEEGTFDPEGRTHWLGFTDIYWMSALIPQERSNAEAEFRSLGDSAHRANLIYQPVTVPGGKQVSRTTQLFVGAKESNVLADYADEGITLFDKAIDWGWFEIIEKPILWTLRALYDLVGNFGVAIILLTVIVRALMFPIAQKQFASMAAMKAIQPKMKAIQERYKDDRQKQQQEIMGLYKKEGVNPLAGCLPLLLQIPIFFGLYKVLMLSIDMRHKPFVLWIEDLSAPDPAEILNLFGLLPFDPPGFLGIGVLAVLLGVTMWLTFKMNPAAMDPMQQQIFNIMPWVLMFVMAPFAAGLLLYWNTSNILTLAQQKYLYSRHPQLRAQSEKEKEDRTREEARKT